MNVQLVHVLTVHSALIKKEDISVNVQMECPEIHTRLDATLLIQFVEKQNAQLTSIALQILSVIKDLVSVHAQIFCVAQMLSVNRKIMLDGAVVKLDL